MIKSSKNQNWYYLLIQFCDLLRFPRDIDGKLPKMDEGKKKKNPDQDLTIRFYRQFAKHFRLFPWILAKGYSGRFGGAPLKRRGHFFPPQIMRNRGTAIVWKTFRLKSDLLARRNFFFLPPPLFFFFSQNRSGCACQLEINETRPRKVARSGAPRQKVFRVSIAPWNPPCARVNRWIVITFAIRWVGEFGVGEFETAISRFQASAIEI